LSYPSSLDAYTPKTDGVDEVLAAHVNSLQDSVVAIETELGTDPAGSLTDLKTRLAVSLSNAGLLRFAASGALTISGGAITATQNWHRVDTESSAASDNLDTITAGADGQILFLRSTNDARDIIIRHGVDNIVCGGAGNVTLGLTSDLAILIYDANLSKWIVLAGISFATANTWTGTQTFAAAIALPYQAVNANATLDATFQSVAVDASGGAITITLPAAASCTGRQYDILKADSSANAVTVDGNGTETINGAATKVLSNQYTAVTIRSNGSGWYIW
jgi:hypothetical protein